MLSTNWIKVFRLWLICFEDWPIRILTFAWWMLKARNTMVSWQAFPSLPPRAHLAFLSCLNKSLFLPFQTPSTQASRSTELKFWFIGREFNRHADKFGFPRYKTNSKPDLRGKRQGFDGKKPNWNALWRNISRDIAGPANSSAKWGALKIALVSQFCSYFEAASPNCFDVFCKMLLQSIFLASIINKNKNKSRNSEISQTNSKATFRHSEATLAHLNATLKHSWASRISWQKK